MTFSIFISIIFLIILLVLLFLGRKITQNSINETGKFDSDLQIVHAGGWGVTNCCAGTIFVALAAELGIHVTNLLIPMIIFLVISYCIIFVGYKYPKKEA